MPSLLSRQFVLMVSVALTACLFSSPAAATDHSTLVSGPLETGSDATRQCLKCHAEAASQIMQTAHWTWQRPQKVNGRQVDLGKINAFNNFCTSTPSNRVHCSECHIGYGWRDKSFDFS